MAGLPVTIRLLDPPLHEFLPHADQEMQEVADWRGAVRGGFYRPVKHPTSLRVGCMSGLEPKRATDVL